MGRSEECAQVFSPQSHIPSGLNQQDLISSDVSKPTVASTQREDGGLGAPVKGVNLVFPWIIANVFFSLQADFCFCFRRVLRWRGGVEGVLLLPLPVCLQSRFRQCQHVLAPTGALLCCCLTKYTGYGVAAGCEDQSGHS